jgi:epoxyqueuosine reductase
MNSPSDYPATRVKQVARDVGFDLVGICSPETPDSIGFFSTWLAAGFHGEMEYLESSLPLRADLNSVLPGVQSVIAVGLNYNQAPAENPKVARYAVGRDYHKVLRTKMRKLARVLDQDSEGYLWRACVDSAPVMEREYAQRAGLGWFGKNTCLINSHRGSWFFLGVLLTTALIERDAPAVGGCGSCRACLDACPTGAIVQLDDVWTVDARRCISYLTIEKRGEFSAEESVMIGDWTFGCDICQEVCPFNQPRDSQPLRAVGTRDSGFLDRRELLPLDQLVEMPVETWDEMTRGSAIRRAGYEGLKRNARANRRNRG